MVIPWYGFPLRDLIEGVASTYRESGARGLNWDNQVDKDFVVIADREKIFRVLFNLARNALEVDDDEDAAGTQRTIDVLQHPPRMSLVMDAVECGDDVEAVRGAVLGVAQRAAVAKAKRQVLQGIAHDRSPAGIGAALRKSSCGQAVSGYTPRSRSGASCAGC